MINLVMPILLTSIIISKPNEGRRPVPERSEWNKMCLANTLEKHGYDSKYGKQWGSLVDKALAKAMCTCRHEKMKRKDNMTFQEYINAAEECGEEFSKDYTKSIIKYLKMDPEMP